MICWGGISMTWSSRPSIQLSPSAMETCGNRRSSHADLRNVNVASEMRCENGISNGGTFTALVPLIKS